MLSGTRVRYGLGPALRCMRYLCTAPDTKVVVDKAMLSKLRKKTGFPLLNCRNALEKFNNDYKEAEVWMREQAQKEGWAKASKLEGRPMSQGLVGLLQDEGSATIVEVNCETDFVARNDKFQDLVSRITQACHRNFSGRDEPKVTLSKEELNSLQDQGKTLADQVALTVGALGENIALRRAAFIKKEPSTVISTFIHASGPQIVRDQCQLGKFAAIVKMEVPNVGHLADQVCQHVVGMNPTSVGDWNLPAPTPTGKKGKKKGAQTEEVKVDESALLNQEFLMESGVTVRGFLHNNAPQVLDFVRLECGEDLGEED